MSQIVPTLKKNLTSDLKNPIQTKCPLADAV